MREENTSELRIRLEPTSSRHPGIHFDPKRQLDIDNRCCLTQALFAYIKCKQFNFRILHFNIDIIMKKIN